MPIAFVEALGRATIARAQLESSLNLVVVILAFEPTRFGTCRPTDPFEVKVDYLGAVSRSRLLKHEWWRILRRIAADARTLNDHYSEAAMSSIYSRGGGFLEEMMRPIAQTLNLPPPSLNMTPGRIDVVAVQLRELARDACSLATALLAAVERLSIKRGEPC